MDIAEVARACVAKDVLFEINCAHEHPDISAIIEADRVGVDFIINSDAHFQETVGNLDYGVNLVEKLGIAPEQVANRRQGGGHKQWKKKKSNCTYS